MKIFRYLKGKRLKMMFGFIIKLIGTVMDLLIPMILAYIIDEVTELNMIIILGIVMVICALIGFLGNVIANKMASDVARYFTTNLRHDLFVKINTLSASQLDEATSSSIISRMTTDTYNVHQMVGMMQRIGVRAPVLLIGGILVTLFLDPVLTLILLSTLPLITLVIVFFTKKGLPLFTSVQHAIDNMIRTIRENITGIRVIKALSKGDYERKRFEKVNNEVYKTDTKASLNMTRINPCINLLLNLGLVFVILIGSFRVNNGIIKTGVIISFTTYFTIILNAMVMITRIFMIFSKSLASSNRIEKIFALEEDLKTICNDEESNYYIEFRDVDFSYHKDENYTVNNIMLKVEKGESVGIIGKTGCGKSTIINLLMRYYDVSRGAIFVGGKDIRSYDLSDYRKKFGVVFQNDSILNDTISNNIVFGREYDEEKLIKAAKLSNAYEFISNKEDGFEFLVSARGTNLSGGQKQRLLIARALYDNPEILIFDDAMSALDYKTDASLRNNIRNNFKEITIFNISSRISSIMDYKHILVLENGVISAYGNHDYLVENCESYKEIYELQMGGIRDEL